VTPIVRAVASANVLDATSSSVAFLIQASAVK
jgi:hypothetical protein